MHAEFSLQLATLYGFLLALARVSGILVFVPIPGFSAAPDASRVVLALALSITLFPSWHTFAPPEGQNWIVARLLGAIGTQAFFGLTVGLAVAFLLEGAQLAAQVLGLQAGYSYASTVDPTTQADTTTLQLMAQLLAGTLFFAFGFDRQVLRALAGSLESARKTFPLQGSEVEAMIRLGASIFASGMQLAIPVLALLVLLDMAFAVLGRLHAQLQLLSLSFTIKMLVGLAFLAEVLAAYPAIFERTGAVTFNVLDRILSP
jgi:flagellar biosynthesis protein FliR